MADEQEALAQVEAETPIEQEASEPVNLNAPVEAEQEPETPVEEPVEELEEFEWNGKAIKAPKGLKDGVLMHADYTKKTQEVADRRRELDTREQSIAQQAKAIQEEAELHGHAYSIKTQLDQYAKVDWDQWDRDDPVEAMSGWRRYQQLQQDAQRVVYELQNRQNERARTAQQDTAKRLEETRRYAETNINGWTPEVDAKVTEFATKELGFDRETLISAYTPQIYRALYLAHIGNQALQKAAAKPASPSPVPLTTVAAKAAPPARKSLSDMSMDEYVAHRQKQLAGNRR